MRLSAVLLTLLADVLLTGSALAGDCSTVLFAELPMHVDASGGVTVPMIVAGQTLNMLIDTGGVGSMLTSEAASRVGGPPYSIVDDWAASYRSKIIGYGGTKVVAAVNVASIGFGSDKRGGPMFFYIFPRHLPPGDDGILSNDILKNYDLEFDFANGKFRLYYLGHCDGAPRALFGGPVSEVPAATDESGHILITTELDGKSIDSFVDTGFWRSTADWETIKNLFHFSETSPNVTTANDFGGKIATYEYPFRSLKIGDVSIETPNIILAPRALSNMKDRQPDLIVGIDILRHLHMYLDHRDRTLYIGTASQ
jgi:predicted aspartyl protease